MRLTFCSGTDTTCTLGQLDDLHVIFMCCRLRNYSCTTSERVWGFSSECNWLCNAAWTMYMFQQWLCIVDMTIFKYFGKLVSVAFICYDDFYCVLHTMCFADIHQKVSQRFSWHVSGCYWLLYEHEHQDQQKEASQGIVLRTQKPVRRGMRGRKGRGVKREDKSKEVSWPMQKVGKKIRTVQERECMRIS